MRRMGIAVAIMMAISIMAPEAQAFDLIKMNANIHSVPINLYKGGAMDSVLVIRGKIDMGQINYYSALPFFAEGAFTIDGKYLEVVLAEFGATTKADVVPQFKSSAAAGWTIYIYLPTGNNPNNWQKFQAMGNVVMKSMGAVRVKYQQSSDGDILPVIPGQGAQISKSIGSVQPK